MSLVLTANGYKVTDSYVSSTPVDTFDIVFDWTSSGDSVTDGADKQIIAGNISYAVDGGQMYYYTFTTSTLNAGESSRNNGVTSRTSSGNTTSVYGLESSADLARVHYYGLGTNSSDTAIYGERLQFYMEIHLGRVSNEFYANMMCKFTTTAGSGSVYTGTHNMRTTGNLHYIRFKQGNYPGNNILAYNIRKYSLNHNGKVGD